MSDTSSAPADQAIREQALDVTRSFIVEAPAGSGKTELLTRRYLSLLARVNEPEEILAITFTRKAAAEMRARVLKALALASDDTPPDNVMAQTSWSLARAVRDTDNRRDWRLLTHPARLRIMTIDALNASLARQLPLLSGAGAALPIARDARELYAEVALRLIERLSGRDATAHSVARLLRHLDNQYTVFEHLLANELARREHWLDVGLMRFAAPELRARLEGALADVVRDELSTLPALIPANEQRELIHLATHAAKVLLSGDVHNAITQCDALLDLPPTEYTALPQWRGIAALLLTDEGTWRARITKNHGFPPTDKPNKQRIEQLISRLQNDELAAALHRVRALPDARYTEVQWQVLTDLLDVLRLAITELEVVMRERSEADYVANAIAARRALGAYNEPSELALRLDYRLQHILVDEFQDTSRGQVELLALLTSGWSGSDGRTLFCVGDPMQSIYRFRHADVGLFLNLKRHGLNQLQPTSLRLSVNFRSAKPVLDWINDTFANVLPRHDDPDRGSVAFTPSDARAGSSLAGGVTVHAITDAKPQAREAEAEQVAALIEAKLSADRECRIAVLVSNRSHLHWIVRSLLARHVAFRAVDIDPLNTRPTVLDLIALTRALVHLGDRTAWLAVLRAPWCGLALADLHALCDTAPTNRTVWDAISQALDIDDSYASDGHATDTHQAGTQLSADGRARLARIRPLLKRALTLRGRLGLRDCVERTWLALGGPATVPDTAALDDAEAYFARLGELERNGDLEDVAQLEYLLRDLYARAPTQSDVRVELMTIHRAKGLEYDVVILPGLDSSTRGDEPPMLRVQELPQVAGERALLLAPIAPRGSDKESIYAWLDQLDRERGRLERGRLLYVAATRAVRELHLFGAVEPNGKPRAHTFLHLLWPRLEHHFGKATSDEATVAAAEALPSVASCIETRRLPLDWSPPPPDGPLRTGTSLDTIDDQALHPEFEWVGETARHIGTLVHREIERIARSGSDASTAMTSVDESQRYAVALAELGVPPALRAAGVERVQTALRNLLADDRGRWLLERGTHREAVSELALTGMIGSDVVNGVVDRMIVDSDGVCWIVDFKTSSHEGGGLEEFIASEVTRYRPQLQRYARLVRGYRPGHPIKAALYFPLLKAWREVALTEA